VHKLAYRLTGGSLLAAAMLAIQAPRAAAQRTLLRGRVVDTTGAPVQDADIVVLPDSLHAVTSPDGRFSVGPVARGDHNIRIRRLGFQFIDTTVTTPADAPFVFRMAQIPITLQAVVAEALSARLPRVVLREQHHIGVQLYGTTLDTLLHRMPGTTVEEDLTFNRAAGLKLLASSRSHCLRAVYVDGDSTRAPIRYYISKDEIAAIEVFDSPDFVNEPFSDELDSAKVTGTCMQLILIWSKYYKQPPWAGH
jgi:Carboxypeptidase regulatory-like domain